MITTVDKSIIDRNTALEAGLLLANKDIAVLRSFVLDLSPTYGGSKILSNSNLGHFRSLLNEARFRPIDDVRLYSIYGALKSHGMEEEAEVFMSTLVDMRKASEGINYAVNLIERFLEDGTQELQQKTDEVLDKAGCKYKSRDYANIGIAE